MKSYKVKNEAGQEWEVDEDKIDLAAKDGYLPVVTNGKVEHRVDFKDIPLAKKDGYLPKTGDSFMEAKDTFFDSMNQMIPGSGLIDKAVAATYAGMQEVGDIFRDDANKKDFKDRYQEALDSQDTERKVTEEKYPITSTVGSVAGIVPNVMIPNPYGKATGVIGAGQRILANTALSVADSATRNKDELIDEDRGLEDGVLAGGINTAVESLPLVGKVAKVGKRLLPATEGAFESVNKTAAKLGSLVPGTDINSDELFELMSDVSTRRKARNPIDKKVFEKFSEALTTVDDITDDQAAALYKKAEESLFNNVGEDDIEALFGPISDIRARTKAVQSRPELYGRANKILTNVDGILSLGTETERFKNMPTFGKTIEDIAESPAAGAVPNVLAHRLIEARRYIDDVTKNVDYDKMLKTERAQIIAARDSINRAFDGAPSAKPLREADEWYSNFTQKKKNALNKLEMPLPSGKREFTPEKVEQFLKSEAAQSKFIEREIKEFGDFMAATDVEGAGAAKGVFDYFNKAKETTSMMRELEKLKRASGGPSSQSINTIAQIYGIAQTSGVSILALPITNPSAWMKLVDSVGSSAEKGFLNKVTEASRKVLETLPPNVVTRMYMMGREDEEK